MENPDEAVVTSCCTDVYNHPLVLRLLNGILHPGGLALSALMAEKMGVTDQDTLLDVASGEGTTAIFLSHKFSCSVYGIDASPLMIEKASTRVTELNLSGHVAFKQSMASRIPYNDNFFSGAYSECSLCTFPDKRTAIREIYRVLQKKGKFGLNDVVIQNRELLDSELQNLLGRALCIADALSPDEYTNLVEGEGFVLREQENFTHLLTELVNRAAGNTQLLSNTSDTNLQKSLDDAKSIITKVQKQIASDNIGYHLFIFEKI
jgi:arsenite methyltransferase